MGASPALELAATLLAIREGIVPPTANFVEADPACDLDYVTDGARGVPIKAALSNAFAFGGLNAVLAVNPLGPLLCCREAAKRMSTKHGGAGGSPSAVAGRGKRGGRS